MGGYFFVLGLAFMFIEIAFIQKLILFLSHPLYSVAVVLSGFLIFAGLGSRYSTRLVVRVESTNYSVVGLLVAVIFGVSVIYVLTLTDTFARLAGLSDVFKVTLSLLLIAPLAFCMGMPFPIGLSRLAADAGDFIPWAWGLNGFASVLGASLATLLAIEFGFTILVLVALALYMIAAALFRRHA